MAKDRDLYVNSEIEVDTLDFSLAASIVIQSTPLYSDTLVEADFV